jgi:hypothetical protein
VTSLVVRCAWPLEVAVDHSLSALRGVRLAVITVERLEPPVVAHEREML